MTTTEKDKEALFQILDQIYDYKKSHKQNLIVLAGRLSEVEKRKSPWGWRYINSLLKGYENFAISSKLARAIEKLSVELDGSHPWQTAREITVLSPNGVEPGSVITGHTVYCPGCGVKFVPDYGHRRWCHICRPPRKR